VDELADRSSDPQFFRGLGFLPNPDEVLRKRGDRPEVLGSLLTDPHIYGTTQVRKAAVLGTEFQVLAASDSPADKRAAELCELVVDHLDMEYIIGAILDAPLKGYRALEIMWSKGGGRWIPERIVDRPNRRIVFGEDDNAPRVLTRRHPFAGVEAPVGKLLIAQHQATYENPYGEAVLSRCLWPFVFKTGGIKFWLRFAEKYGSAFAIGKLPRSAPKEDYEALASDLERMVEDAVAAIPNDGSVELLEAAGKTASSQLYERLVEFENGEISKAVLGQTLTTDAGDRGTQALGTVHNDVRSDLVAADQRIVVRTIGELFGLITHLNVPNATPPRLSFYEEEVVPTAWAELIDKVRKFIPTPERWAREKLGNIPEPESGEDVLDDGSTSRVPVVTAPPSQPRSIPGRSSSSGGGRPVSPAADDDAQFSAESVDWLDELYRATVAEYRREVAPGLRDLVAAELDKADNTIGLRAVPELLARAFPVDGVAADALGKFEQLLGRSMFTAALAAYADVELEASDSAEFVAGVTPEPLRFLEAEQAFAERIALTAAQVGKLADEFKARAFWLSGVATLDVVEDVQVELERVIRNGGTIRDFRAGLDELVARKGWSGLSPHRAQTVFRNAVQAAYTGARYRAMRSPRVLERRPFWEYLTAGDDLVRPAHAALDGTVLPADDPAWSSIFPQNGHRCRCTVRTLSAREVTARGLNVENGQDVLTTPRPIPGSTGSIVPTPDRGFDRPPDVAYPADLSGYPREAAERYVARARNRWQSEFSQTGIGRDEWLTRVGADTLGGNNR
jgi:SPP1 gp7 family putative phage head morphogenesis protein